MCVINCISLGRYSNAPKLALSCHVQRLTRRVIVDAL